MELAQALRLGPQPRLALVGAGGKTSALFQLGRELVSRPSQRTVLLTATTHLGMDQASLASRHIVLRSQEDLASIQGDLPGGVLLFTGPPDEDGRTSGLDGPTLEGVRRLADVYRAPLLVEADGSRCKPFKAPADHEPAIPAWVDTVVVVAGLSALGQPLSPEWVHRPERFAALSGLAMGETITPEALSRVLVSPAGGLKAIPAGARRLALLNQADTPQLQAVAQRLAAALQPAYQSVIVASLSPGGSHGEPQVHAAYEPAAGVILAAGGSKRLGRPKQLLSWRGEPLVRHVASTALAAGLSPVVVVTGAGAGGVEAALEGLPVELTYNDGWEAGQSTSLIAGLERLPADTGSVVFLLADQPQVPATLVRSLVELHATTLSPLVAPQAAGRRANPVLFDRVTFPDLLSLSGDVGGRLLFSRYPVTWLDWHDPNLLLDVDTREDYERLLGL